MFDIDTERFNMVGNARFIELTQGRVAIVSAEDYEYLMQWEWSFQKSPHGNSGYAKRSDTAAEGDPICQSTLMHRVIAQRMGLITDTAYDHEDRNKLNNQRYNIRPATGSQNNVNCPIRRHNTSGYNGVSPFKAKGVEVGYEAYIHRGNKKVRLGYFYPFADDSAMQAAYAHDVAAIRLFGEDFPLLNNVDLGDDIKEFVQQDVLYRITDGTEGKAKPVRLRGKDLSPRKPGGGRPKGSKDKGDQ